MEGLVEKKYGYVENVAEELNYKNIDYRDTTVPLWNELYRNHTDADYRRNLYKNQSPDSIPDDIQRQVNLALCASIIELGKSMHHSINTVYEKLETFEKRLVILEKEILKPSQNNKISSSYGWS